MAATGKDKLPKSFTRREQAAAKGMSRLVRGHQLAEYLQTVNALRTQNAGSGKKGGR